MRDVTRVSCSHCGKTVQPRNYAEHRLGCPLVCHHCDRRFSPAEYMDHVKGCLAKKIADWDEAEYATRYFAQVRAISRFPQAGSKRRRSKYRSWGWWLKPGSAILKPDVFDIPEDELETGML